jgi:PadR family transcriptional regulator PadR
LLVENVLYVETLLDSDRELLKGNTPTLVLAVLNDGPMHGYGIAREVERRSNNALKFKEGTLYPALHALERDAMISGEWRREPEGRERKVYHITPAGRGALVRRTHAWNSFATAIGQVIRGGEDDASTSTGYPTGIASEPTG